MKYKMIAADFDGTIYRDDYTISKRTIEAIREYRARGGKFMIATGRLYEAIRPHALSMGLDGEIAVYQGGAVYELGSGARLIDTHIDSDKAVKLIEYVASRFGAETIPMMFSDDKCVLKERNEHTDAFSSVVNISPRYVGDNLNNYISDRGLEPDKLLFLAAKNSCDKVARDIENTFGDIFNVCRSASSLIEVVDKGVSKAAAIKWVARKLSITPAEIIAIGDSENDISMIKYAGLGVAVANAMDNVKACADYISESNDDDGVAKVIEKFCLE